ncbi:putative transcriptional regulatory protein [Lasiodiplodia theobromae]|uniref:Putative transcriptional regulatory protein n=1 Tax=Lasiodiplodia theobromae TaxID=45133 RepID=A0A5N5D306_9PEZI|nr:putative transcriptional regulatory protein [Lasiodiplodia theobromae]
MGDKGSAGQPIGGAPIQPPKRKRLSRACNWCRKQKVRCDESLPSCLNCRLRNLDCVTTEPKSGKELSSADRKHSKKHSKNEQQPPPCRSDPDSPYSSTTASTATSLLVPTTPASLQPETFSTPSSTLASAANAPLPATWTKFATPGTTFAAPQASSREGPLQSPPRPPTEFAAAGDEEPRPSAVLTPQSSDYALNYGDEPVKRKFLGASSSQVLVQWLDLSFSRRGPWPKISQYFRYGITTAEEFSLNLWTSPKPLPPYSECAKYLSVYKSRIYPLFPVLDLPDLAQIFAKFAAKDAQSLSVSDLPSLACCYAVTSIGMDAISGQPSETATEYLTSAYSIQANQRRGMREFLHDTAQLDHRLVEWAQKLPDNLRPGSTLYCTPDDQPFATFFSASYHEALITLHRTALILDTNVFRDQVKRHVLDSQPSYRLSKAEDICVASARTIVQVLNELKSSCGDFVHPLTASSPLLATFVLTISILKHPARWNVRSDLALLLNIATLTEGMFESIGQDPAFNKMFALMRDAASKHTEHATPAPELSPVSDQSQTSGTGIVHDAHRLNLSESTANDESFHIFQSTDELNLINEEPWSQLLSGNLNFETGPWDYDLEALLGLPHFDEGVSGA